MLQRGIRGAITVDNDSVDSIKSAVIELINGIKDKNNFKTEDIAYVIFTQTDDLQSVYPAKEARENFPDWKYVPMMCNQELKIKNSLEKCLRILIVINTELAQNEINHVYLKGAARLREDLNK